MSSLNSREVLDKAKADAILIIKSVKAQAFTLNNTYERDIHDLIASNHKKYSGKPWYTQIEFEDELKSYIAHNVSQVF